MGVNSLPKTVTRQHRGCDLNPVPFALESSSLTTRLPSHPIQHQLDHAQTIGTSRLSHTRQITTPAPHHSIFAGRMLFLTPNQQCQSTEGKFLSRIYTVFFNFFTLNIAKRFFVIFPTFLVRLR